MMLQWLQQGKETCSFGVGSGVPWMLPGKEGNPCSSGGIRRRNHSTPGAHHTGRLKSSESQDFGITARQPSFVKIRGMLWPAGTQHAPAPLPWCPRGRSALPRGTEGGAQEETSDAVG
ncbi:uncharacterized protein LOC111169132 isoform X3 [Delphinapterus leucas]|uniref:Uncharacterized protein LOC111169132 isoform X3 n=1 Tax=Delphinapterus leucas TaxID=9749 RepID=A0A2Y9M9H0_DELLE|nr:uncharacterized protein LOC111169132 isoform X3 [Delphinapterus leucas]